MGMIFRHPRVNRWFCGVALIKTTAVTECVGLASPQTQFDIILFCFGFSRAEGQSGGIVG